MKACCGVGNCLIPFPIQNDTSLPRLAVLQHCLRQGASSRFELEMEYERGLRPAHNVAGPHDLLKFKQQSEQVDLTAELDLGRFYFSLDGLLFDEQIGVVDTIAAL